MTPEEIRERWARFLSGEELSPEDQKGLVDALDADPELRDSLLENLHLDGILHSMSATRLHGEAFVRNLSDCLEPERDATRFIKKVESRLNENPPPTTPPSTGRKSKKDTTRVFRRRPAASTSGETAWKPALIAAAAFFAILLLVTSPTKESRRPGPPRGPIVVVPTEEARLPNATQPPVEQKTSQAPPQVVKHDIPPTPPSIPPEPKPDDRPKPAVTDEDRRKMDEDLKKRPNPPRSPKSDPAPPPSIAEAPTKVERADGNVYLAFSKVNKRRPKKDEAVPLNTDVETQGPGSVALIRFSDDTWVEVLPNSVFRETAAPTATKGRQVYLAYGSVESQITKQSPDRPMVFTTPTAEATIIGTTIRLTVTHDAKLGRTTLEVKEGKVQLTRFADRKSVEVVTGQFAVAATGVDPIPQRSFADEVLVKFGPADVKLQPTWVLDSGEEFDGKRGYGWIGPKNGPPVPGLFWRDGEGKPQPKFKGRFAVRRVIGADPLKTTDITAGWAGVTETWYMPIPNGRYLISVCCGDVTYEQGPHHVSVEGVQIINERKNRVGESIEVKDIPIEVKDGVLTMVVGGNPGSRVSGDGSTDTCINYLLIKRVRK